MPSVKELQERLNELGTTIRKFTDKWNNEKEDWTKEDEANYAQVNKDFDACKRDLDMAQREEEVKNTLEAKPPGADRFRHYNGVETDEEIEQRYQKKAVEQASDKDLDLAFRGWLLARSRPDKLTNEFRESMRRCRVNPQSEYYDIILRRDYDNVRREFRQMTTTAGAGGETVPAGFSNAWEFAQLAYGGMRQVSRVIRTDSGNAITWPTTNDTGNIGKLVVESTGTLTATAATTSSITLNAYKYSSDVIKISPELLRDAAFDMAGELGRMLGERIARVLNAHFTTGTGTGQPNGAVTASFLGATTATAATIAGDDIINLVHSLDPSYRPNARFMMNDAIIAAVRKLKAPLATDRQYLWQPGMQAGVPDMLFGYPVTTNQQMVAVLTTGGKVMLFGDFSKYIIRDVIGVRVKHLVELYAANDLEGFVTLSRHDGEELDAGTYPIKHMVTS